MPTMATTISLVDSYNIHGGKGEVYSKPNTTWEKKLADCNWGLCHSRDLYK